MILEQGWAKEGDLKDIEKKVKKDIEDDVEKIKNDPEPAFDDMYEDIGVGEIPIRGVELGLSRNYL